MESIYNVLSVFLFSGGPTILVANVIIKYIFIFLNGIYAL